MPAPMRSSSTSASRPRHFAYTWGIPVPAHGARPCGPGSAARRPAPLGRNLPGPTRRGCAGCRFAAPTRSTSSAPSSPGGLGPERAYAQRGRRRQEEWDARGLHPRRLAAARSRAGGRPLRVAHLTTVDMSQALLLATELRVDVATGLDTFGLSAPGPVRRRSARRSACTHVPLPRSDPRLGPRRDAGRGPRARSTAAAPRPRRPAHPQPQDRRARPAAGPGRRHPGRGEHLPRSLGAARRPAVPAARSSSARRLSPAGPRTPSSTRTPRTARPWRARCRRAVSCRRQRHGPHGFGPDPAARARIRAELGVADDDAARGGVGRQVAEKGIREYEAAARALAGKARFVWIGPADPDKSDALGAEIGGVDTWAAAPTCPTLYAAFDVFVLPSYREGFSRSAMEAAASGLPMVLSDIRGCREIGDHDEHLLLVPARATPQR